jgi:hypothetical protein
VTPAQPSQRGTAHRHDRLTARFDDGCIPAPTEALMHLVGAHAREVLADTDGMVKAAEERARQIPAVPTLVREVQALRTVLAELVIQVRVLDLGQQQHDDQQRDHADRLRKLEAQTAQHLAAPHPHAARRSAQVRDGQAEAGAEAGRRRL